MGNIIVGYNGLAGSSGWRWGGSSASRPISEGSLE